MNESFESRKAWRIAAMLFVFMAINFMDKIAVGLLAVPMMSDLHLSPVEFGLVGSSFFWLFSVAGIGGGFLADRRRATGLLLGMAAIWAVCQLPMALSSSLLVLVIARVLLGIGEGPAFPVAVHACYKWFPDRKRNMPVALLSLGSAFGLLVAGLFVPQITAHWGWRANFLFLAGLTAVWALLWLAIGREGPIAVDASHVEARGRVLWRRLLTDPTVFACMLMHFVAYWSLALVLTWLPAYLQLGLGFDHVLAGRLYALIILATVPLMLLLPWYSQRLLVRGISSRVGRGLVSALTLVAGGVMFTTAAGVAMSPALRVAGLTIGLGLVPVIYTLGPAMLAEVAPGAQRGALLAIDNSIASVAGMLAPLVSGVLIERAPGAHGYELGFVLCGVLMIVGGIAGALLVRPDRSAQRITMLART